MKISWGTGIAIFYSIFVLVFIALVFKSTTVDNSLVTDEYYKEDLAYQRQFVRLSNTMQLEEDMSIQHNSSNKEIQFSVPASIANAEGDVHFYRPSNSRLDIMEKLDLDAENSWSFPTADLKPGLWKVKVNWEADGKEFYTEKTIVL